MILRKYMSLLGIGSAQIDLILEKEIYRPGESVSGYFLIKGGTIEQQIKRIDCDLVMKDQILDKETVIDTVAILSTSLIESEKLNKIGFTFQLPDSLAASTDKISYQFVTWLTFNKGVESRDLDIIQIVQ